MEATKHDPLTKLLLDTDDTSREMLANVLEKFVGISKVSGELIPKPQYFKQNKKARILILILSRKAQKFLNLVSVERISSEEASKISGVAIKTVRETLSRLKKRQLVNSDVSGWYIPDSALLLVHEYLEKDACVG